MLKSGDILGPYEIRGFVGQGGMGQVYQAFDPRLERTVALKIIVLPQSARTGDSGSALVGELSTRLLREARAVAALSHPNVIAIYDVGESDGCLYLAMEYVVGSSLRSLVGNAELPLARRLRFLIDVARALDAAHRAGIVHRDVKPENVMVREDSVVKVLDFGIARRTVASSQKPEEQHAIDTVTGGGTIAGTPVYMAPEQIKGGDVDSRCDQFGWGVMAYELLTGARPWRETGDVLALVANILTEPTPEIRARSKDVPAVVEETILRALAKEPAKRFPTMGAIADALEPFASVTTGGDRVQITPRRSDDEAAYAATTRVPTTASGKLREGAAPAPSPRRRALALAAPLVLLGALAAAVYTVRTRTDSRTTPPLPASAPRPLSTVPEAESAYREAMSLWHDGAGAKASAQLAHTVELDRTFAAAHLELALQQAAEGDSAAAQASFQSAYEHRHLLTARDSALLEASEPFIRAKPDLEEWETRLTSIVFRHPRDPELQFYLGRARERQGENEAAKAAFAAAIHLDDGFVPALAAMATTEKNLGNVAGALRTTEICVKRSPIAATCVRTRYDLLVTTGECARAREEATQWRSLEPQSPRPLAELARALYASGAPRPSVEEALSSRWALAPAADRKQMELMDRALLAVTDGDLARAEDLAREYDAGLSLSADSYDHGIPARLRVNLLMEMGRMKDAAKAARVFLDRMAAWASYPFAPDPSIGLYEPLYRAGEMTKAELAQKRREWLEHERRRASEGRTAMDPWVLWATVHGSFAETREEALEAIANLVRDTPLPPPGRRSTFLDFALGKVYVLTSRWDEAIPHLQRVIASCTAFDNVTVIQKARLLLGQAEEAKGELAAAKANYEKITETWPKTSGSTTRRRAEERLGTSRP
jgi:serine/threonine-protein kinase